MTTIKHLNPAYRDLSTTRGTPNKFLIPIEHVRLASDQPSNNPEHNHVLKTLFKEGGWLATFTSIPINL